MILVPPLSCSSKIHRNIVKTSYTVPLPRLSQTRVRCRAIRLREERKMAFVMEFAENLIRRIMEDPRERDRQFREHIYTVKDRCVKTKEMWTYPLRPYGFWTFERHNAQLARDAQISQVPGRRDPYDDLLQQPTFDT